MSFSDDDAELTGNFFVNHWKGAYPLPRAYWLNGFVLVGIAATAVLFLIRQAADQVANLQLGAAVFSLALFLTAGCSVWSIVGIWRSADRHEARGGKGHWAVAAKGAAVLGALNTFGQIVSVSVSSLETAKLAINADPLGAPATVKVIGSSLRIDGPLSLHSASAVARAFADAPSVKKVVLNSLGGRIGEARQIADLVEANRLDTEVDRKCVSACTVILLAGTRRMASSFSSIGFHQPYFPGVAPADLKLLSEDLEAIYAERQLPEDFVRRAMNTPPSSVWYPTGKELLDAKVLNAVTIDWVIDDAARSAADVRKAGPKRVDATTMLASAEAAGPELKFIYSVNTNSTQIDKGYAARTVLTAKKNGVCSSPITRIMVESGAIYRFVYNDRAGRPIADVQITAC